MGLRGAVGHWGHPLKGIMESKACFIFRTHSEQFYFVTHSGCDTLPCYRLKLYDRLEPLKPFSQYKLITSALCGRERNLTNGSSCSTVPHTPFFLLPSLSLSVSVSPISSSLTSHFPAGFVETVFTILGSVLGNPYRSSQSYF